MNNTIEGSGGLQSTILTQYYLNKGLKAFGNEGKSAVINELNQLHVIKAMKSIQKTSLTSEQKHWSLQYLMFLKQKRSGEIKARGCADGRKQRGNVLK